MPLLLARLADGEAQLGQGSAQVPAIDSELLTHQLQPHPALVQLAGGLKLIIRQGPTRPPSTGHTPSLQMAHHGVAIDVEAIRQSADLITSQSTRYQLVDLVGGQATRSPPGNSDFKLLNLVIGVTRSNCSVQSATHEGDHPSAAQAPRAGACLALGEGLDCPTARLKAVRGRVDGVTMEGSSARFHRWSIGLAVCGLALVSAACDGTSSRSTSPAGSSVAGSTRHPCGLLTSADFRAIGTRLVAAPIESEQKAVGLKNCYYDLGSDKDAVYLDTWPSVTAGRDAFAGGKDPAAGAGAPVAIGGVGDDAYWLPTLHALYVTTGSKVLEVTIGESDASDARLEHDASVLAGRAAARLG